MKTAKVRAFFNALIELYSKDTHRKRNKLNEKTAKT